MQMNLFIEPAYMNRVMPPKGDLHREALNML